MIVYSSLLLRFDSCLSFRFDLVYCFLFDYHWLFLIWLSLIVFYLAFVDCFLFDFNLCIVSVDRLPTCDTTLIRGSPYNHRSWELWFLLLAMQCCHTVYFKWFFHDTNLASLPCCEFLSICCCCCFVLNLSFDISLLFVFHECSICWSCRFAPNLSFDISLLLLCDELVVRGAAVFSL